MARPSNLHWMYEVCVCFVNWFATYGVLLWLAWAWVIVQGCCCSSKGSLFAVFFHSGSRKSAVKYSAVSLSLSFILTISLSLSPSLYLSLSLPAVRSLFLLVASVLLRTECCLSWFYINLHSDASNFRMPREHSHTYMILLYGTFSQLQIPSNFPSLQIKHRTVLANVECKPCNFPLANNVHILWVWKSWHIA